MANKEYIIQISTGGYQEKQVTFRQIEEKLRPILKQMPVRAVIMGWAAEPDLYCRTKELLAQSGTELYLWLPVFSETGLLQKVSRLMDYQGEPVGRYHLNEGESFEFYCPNTALNSDAFYQIYEEYFRRLPLDGVFLDRIRYASFSNGRSGVFSCFCPECMKKYEAFGVDAAQLKQLKTEMEKVAAGIGGYKQMPLQMKGYQAGRYRFAHPVWSSFFAAKAKFINAAMGPIIDFFKTKGLRVGLDVFSPFAAYFVGQDIARLAQAADFVKPMMYRQTYAPAGLPFELAGLCRETVPAKMWAEAEKRCRAVLGLPVGDAAIPLSFVQQELVGMATDGAKIYCGIEINYQPSIVPTSTEDIAENLVGLAQTDIKGFVLSWDLLSAPESHIDAVLRHVRHKEA